MLKDLKGKNIFNQQGFTLLELLVVVAITSILLTIAALNVGKLNNDLGNTVSILSGSFTRARTQAISTTSAVRITLKNGEIGFDTRDDCKDNTDTWQGIKNINIVIPTTIKLSSSTLSPIDQSNSSSEKYLLACFNPRGDLSDTGPEILDVKDNKGRTNTITIYATGGVVQGGDQ